MRTDKDLIIASILRLHVEKEKIRKIIHQNIKRGYFSLWKKLVIEKKSFQFSQIFFNEHIILFLLRKQTFKKG